ncbi:epithelial-stromal interaction protein 1 [Pseudoliparis swirei]|uniref:epithelial-stromal interaction protein 1 n=1 Tax=Pseudoliparis swirei TaxID=2059687 RepID=UPI0024BD69FD|nr:epithelial-stromal interaction protein 1 [Pseudoliparis swirei]
MEHNQRDANKQPNRVPSSGGPSGEPRCERTPEDPNRDSPDSGNPQPTGREPQYSAGYTMIPPNESKRDKLLRDVQKEEETCKRWKEANRVHTVHMTPETLGGSATLSEARERQQTDLRYSKQQKMLKKIDSDRKKRQEEEEEYQKMKDIQREKAERLEERKQQDEQRRREQLSQDHSRKTELFLQRFERTASGPPAPSCAAHTSSRSEAVEGNQREESKGRDVQQDHRRVNQAFLDNLEGQPGGSEKETKEGFGHQPSNPPGQQRPPAQLNQHPDQSSSDCWTDDADPDYDWALEELMTSFPDYNRAFLEDILDQCNSDYEEAFTLLNIR